MPLDADDIRAALLAKGMVRDATHHEMFRKEIGGVTTLITRLSWRGRHHQVSDNVASAMARQLCLRLAEFRALVSCDLTEARWEGLVSERCSDGRNPSIGR